MKFTRRRDQFLLPVEQPPSSQVKLLKLLRYEIPRGLRAPNSLPENVKPMNNIHRISRSVLAKTLLIVLLAISSLLFLRPLITSKAKDNPPKERQKALTTERTKPATSETDELARRINGAIDESEFAAARWGIEVVSMSNGTTLYQRDADKLFTPASNMKIYTTGVALDLLGADYRWR